MDYKVDKLNFVKYQGDKKTALKAQLDGGLSLEENNSDEFYTAFRLGNMIQQKRKVILNIHNNIGWNHFSCNYATFFME